MNKGINKKRRRSASKSQSRSKFQLDKSKFEVFSFPVEKAWWIYINLNYLSKFMHFWYIDMKTSKVANHSDSANK